MDINYDAGYENNEQRTERIKEPNSKGRKEYYRSHYNNWYPSSLNKRGSTYHIVQDGILNKQDCNLLFEGEKGLVQMPPEEIEQVNVYHNVELSSSVIKMLTENNIRVNYYDRYGHLMGTYMPCTKSTAAQTAINQCGLLLSSNTHRTVAQNMEESAIHNIRENIRYYLKRIPDLHGYDDQLSEHLTSIKKALDINSILLIEARARYTYYESFNRILDNPGFVFNSRSKRPPQDPINALISFGNTLLYTEFQKIIQKTSLDIRMGVIHAANRRSMSLNLDFADIFKPIIIDRIIFSMINRKQIDAEKDFCIQENGGVYLSPDGKRKFIAEFICARMRRIRYFWASVN